MSRRPSTHSAYLAAKGVVCFPSFHVILGWCRCLHVKTCDIQIVPPFYICKAFVDFFSTTLIATERYI